MRQAVTIAARDLRATYVSAFGIGCTAAFAALAGVLLVFDLRGNQARLDLWFSSLFVALGLLAALLTQRAFAEEERSGIRDPSHFAYPTYAKAAMNRRDNLRRSAQELRIQLEDAKAAFGEALEELKKVELLDERDQMRDRAVESARESAELPRMNLARARI